MGVITNMNFTLKEAMELLERTPRLLNVWLSGLSDNWLDADEGEGTWTPVQVVGHLIEGEKHNWLPRLEMILQKGESEQFPPFDRYAHLNRGSEIPLEIQLQEFESLRRQNLARLQHILHSEEQLELTGQHPQFGKVNARELLSTWVVHDLTHLSQIMRVMAKRYADDVGPWIEFLRILK